MSHNISANTTPILIVGAGPVGLFFALALNRYGIKARIIDKKSGLSDKSKAVGIHIRSQLIWQEFGILDTAVARGHRVEGIQFISGKDVLVDASFADLDVPFRSILDIAQDQTEIMLAEELRKNGIEVEWETELTALTQTETHISATINKKTGTEIFQAHWLVGCDGAHSTTRHQLNLEFKGDAYPQHWWLADLQVKWQRSNNRMVAYLAEEGPFALFPMGKNRYRLVVLAPKNNKSDPTLDDIKKAAAERCGDAMELYDATWLAGFNIHHRQVQQYQVGRVFLAGDAAHIHSPMGGQGLNTGMQDAYNLVWKIALVEKQIAKNNILNTYHAERYEVGRHVVNETDRMTKAFSLQNALLVNMRNHLMPFISSFLGFKEKMLTNMAELTIDYQKSALTEQKGKLKGFHAGELIPYFNLLLKQNVAAIDSYHLLKGTTQHLLLFAGNNAKNLPLLNEITQEIKLHYSHLITTHLIVSDNALAKDWQGEIWFDNNGEVEKQFHITEPTAILCRPDKYIAYLETPASMTGIMDYLKKWYNESV